MPEIGECYAIANNLSRLGKVKEIKISAKAKNNIIKHNQNLKLLIGSIFEKPFAYGKSIMFPIVFPDQSEGILCSQLGMTGSWFINDAYSERGHDHVIIVGEDTKFRYSDPRMFGKMKFYKGSNLKDILFDIIKEHKWGIDPIQSEENEVLEQLLKLQNSKSEIKNKLLSQDLIFGVGNYLASEALFIAKIKPQRPCNKISLDEYKKLAKAIQERCRTAEKYQGYSFAGGYILPDGSHGSMNEHILMYGKKTCPTCGSKVKTDYINTRITYSCAKCQS